VSTNTFWVVSKVWSLTIRIADSTRNSQTALYPHPRYEMSQKSIRNYGKYGLKFICAHKYNTAFYTLYSIQLTPARCCHV